MLQVGRIEDIHRIAFTATTSTHFRSSKSFIMSGTDSYRRPSPDQTEYTMTSQYPENTTMLPHQNFAEVPLETPRHYVPGHSQTVHPVQPHEADTHPYPTVPFSGFYTPPTASTGPPPGMHYMNATANHESIYPHPAQRGQLPHAGQYRSEFHNVGASCENQPSGSALTGSTRGVDTYYYSSESHAVQDIDRDTKRVRMSPVSDYDSATSEYDSRDRYLTVPLTGYDTCSHDQFGHTGFYGLPGQSLERGYSPGSSAVGDHPLRTAPATAPVSPLRTHGLPKKERKGRRKLAPVERQQVHELRKLGACTRCWGLKMKCDDKSPCHRCQKLGDGTPCVRVHFVDLDVFSKWLVESYSATMSPNALQFKAGPPRTATISHEQSLNVTLQLPVHLFQPTSEDQVIYWYKERQGWNSLRSPPFAIKHHIAMDVLERYIQDHTYHYINTSFTNSPVLADIFMAAYRYSLHTPHFILSDALQLWTATQLLIHGASLHPGSDSLGVLPLPVTAIEKANQLPLPRVLGNQLDHLLERRVWQLEKQLLSELQKRIFARKRHEWLKIFFTLVVFMNALERDSWRLYYWTIHDGKGYAWKHPTPAGKLIEKNNTLAESLGAHFKAISKGINPFASEWSKEQTATLLEETDEGERRQMLDTLERIGSRLREPPQQLRMENVLASYVETDYRSLDFLYTGKVMSL